MWLTRFLDWLDESAAGVIRVAYLLAGVIAVASYFSDGNVPRSFSDTLNAILPWALAGALEVHTYLSARRVRAAYQDLSAAVLGSDEYERAGRQMRVNLWILAGLLAFSMYNQLQYLAATWTPPHTPLTPPGPFAYLIRAIITPAAFMAAAFLAPMGEGMAVQVQHEAHNLARLAFKAASAQWKRRLREMQQQQQDVTGALVGLIDDPSERRVIEGIWRAMHGASPLLTTAPASASPVAIPSIEAPQASQEAPQEAPAPEVEERTDTRAAGAPEAVAPDPEPQGPGPRGRRNVQTQEARGGRRRSTQAQVITLSPDRPRRADSGRRSAEARERWDREVDAAADILTVDPFISTRELARRLTTQLGQNIHAARATEIRRAVQPVRPSREELASAQELAQESEASA